MTALVLATLLGVVVVGESLGAEVLERVTCAHTNGSLFGIEGLALHPKAPRLYVYYWTRAGFQAQNSTYRVQVFDVADPSNVTSVMVVDDLEATYGCRGALWGFTFAPDGEMFSMGCNSEAWKVDPLTLQPVLKSGKVDFLGNLAAGGGYVIGDSENGATVLRSGDLSVVSRIPLQWAGPNDVALVGGRGFVSAENRLYALGQGGFKVQFNVTGDCYRMASEEGVLYCMDGKGLLKVFDVSEASKPPRQVGSMTPTVECPYPHMMEYSQHTLYVNFGSCGVLVIDVTTPERPRQLPSISIRGADRLGVRGQYGFLSAEEGLLSLLLQTSPPTPPPVCRACSPGDSACCDPSASPAQYCPNGRRCCACGGSACACL